MVARIEGNSMNPSLLTNDYVFLDKEKQPNVGDVVMFMYEGQYLIHRIVRKKQLEIWCKGDNSVRIEKIDYAAVIGVVSSVLRQGKIIPFPKE